MMAAPRVENIITLQGIPIGIVLLCPEAHNPPRALRCESPADYKYPSPIGNPSPFGFIARCDVCGFRVEMSGDRLPTVRMLEDGFGYFPLSDEVKFQ